ncbi:hypothetical protein [Clinch densovirus 1]|uniref:NS2 n=1 Tax=Clinch densovirus 1 TaxID=2767029 RepID=A0A7G8YXA7_9VIRU|nr:hypothetical protein QKU46_gp4 [Clinch densovirus 1]QNL09582.1 hypothetical protein [Clinch densovirus 1]
MMDPTQVTQTISQLWETLWERYGDQLVSMPGFWMRMLDQDFTKIHQQLVTLKQTWIPMLRYWDQQNSLTVKSFHELKERLSNLFGATLATSWPVEILEKLTVLLDESLALQEITPEICASYQSMMTTSMSSMTVRTQDPVVDVKSSKKRKSNLSFEDRCENARRLAQSNQIHGNVSCSISFPTDDGYSSLKWEDTWSDYRLDIKVYKAEDIKGMSSDKYWERALFRAQVNYARNSPLKKTIDQLKSLVMDVVDESENVQSTSAKKWKK